MASPPFTPGGVPNARDLGAILRAYLVKVGTSLRLQPSIQPVSVFDDGSQLAKRLLPAQFICGGRAPDPGVGLFPGFQLICNVDTLIIALGAQGVNDIAVDVSGALRALWVETSTFTPVPCGDPMKKVSQNRFSVGSSSVEFSAITGSFISANWNYAGLQIMVPAGAVFQMSDSASHTAAFNFGVIWQEFEGN